MKIGLVCPYVWDVPGGVQAHVRDLAERLIDLGHQVSVFTPVDEPDSPGLPPYVVPAGRAVPVPYNGSVARLCFGPLSLARTRRWLRRGEFDVLHIHEPTVPSVSMIACFAAHGAVVATFHTATARSRSLQVFGTTLQPGLEKITGRIAVSAAARRVVMEHLGFDAVLVPNGVNVDRFVGASPLPGLPEGPTVVFLGRLDEDRKGLAVLLAAWPRVLRAVPGAQLLLAGPGEVDVPRELSSSTTVLGRVSDAQKAGVFASGDVYCAPNTHGESFGIVLIEAMATGTPVVASDLEAFRTVLLEGEAGVLFPAGDDHALARALTDLLRDVPRRDALSHRASQAVLAYDWGVVTKQVVEVYETVAAAAPVELDDPTTLDDLLGVDEVEDLREEDDPGRVSESLRRWLAVVRERVAP